MRGVRPVRMRCPDRNAALSNNTCSSVQYGIDAALWAQLSCVSHTSTLVGDGSTSRADWPLKCRSCASCPAGTAPHSLFEARQPPHSSRLLLSGSRTIGLCISSWIQRTQIVLRHRLLQLASSSAHILARVDEPLRCFGPAAPLCCRSARCPAPTAAAPFFLRRHHMHCCDVECRLTSDNKRRRRLSPSRRAPQAASRLPPSSESRRMPYSHLPPPTSSPPPPSRPPPRPPPPVARRLPVACPCPCREKDRKNENRGRIIHQSHVAPSRTVPSLHPRPSCLRPRSPATRAQCVWAQR